LSWSTKNADFFLEFARNPLDVGSKTWLHVHVQNYMSQPAKKKAAPKKKAAKKKAAPKKKAVKRKVAKKKAVKRKVARKKAVKRKAVLKKKGSKVT
jgi:hypothetical protein